MGERWHIAGNVGTRKEIRDENGLFVAECIAEDAPGIAETPRMIAALRKAERFLAGFEGDTELLDDPIDDDLAEIRRILAVVDGPDCGSCHQAGCGGECLG